jgi:hypothetical protein
MKQRPTIEEQVARWQARLAKNRQRMERQAFRARLGRFLLKLHLLWPGGPWYWLYRRMK